MAFTRHVYQEIARRRDVSVACTKCGKKLRRTIKAYQTLNPFNRNEDGSSKTAEQIWAELPAKLDHTEAKLRETAVCRSCENQEPI